MENQIKKGSLVKVTSPLISLQAIWNKILPVIDIKEVNFASGIVKYAIIEFEEDNIIEIFEVDFDSLTLVN